MKRFFTGAVLFAALLYAAAELTLQSPPDDGVIRLRWATDENPARNLQTATFAKLQLLLKEENVVDWDRFRLALRDPAASPSAAAPARDVLQRLAAALDANAPDAVTGEDPGPLLDAVNRLLDRPEIFAGIDGGGLELSRDGQLLIAKPDDERTEVEVIALNRRILEAALPGVVRPARRIEVAVESGAREKLIVQCATGTGPDIVDVYGINQMHAYVGAGILLDLTPHASKMGFGPENTFRAIKDNLTVEGRQYRFPCNVWANCVVYNRRVFDDHGVPYPAEGWTWTDFIRASRKIVAGPGASGEKHLALANYNNVWMFGDLLIGHGGSLFTPDGLVSRLDTPEATAALRLYHDMMHVHRVIPTPAEAAAMSSQGGWGSGGIVWFCDGRAAMIIIGRWLLNRLGQYPDLVPHLGTAVLPRAKGQPSRGQTDCRAAGINVKSPHREAALKFLQYLAGPEYGRLIVQDGDSLPPNPALARDGDALANTLINDPNFHQPFADAMTTARPLDPSPFIDAGQVERWVKETVERVENELVAPEEGVRALAAEINQRIRRNLERRGDLQRKFAQVTGRPWTRDWRHADVRR